MNEQTKTKLVGFSLRPRPNWGITMNPSTALPLPPQFACSEFVSHSSERVFFANKWRKAVPHLRLEVELHSLFFFLFFSLHKWLFIILWCCSPCPMHCSVLFTLIVWGALIEKCPCSHLSTDTTTLPRQYHTIPSPRSRLPHVLCLSTHLQCSSCSGESKHVDPQFNWPLDSARRAPPRCGGGQISEDEQWSLEGAFIFGTRANEGLHVRPDSSDLGNFIITLSRTPAPPPPHHHHPQPAAAMMTIIYLWTHKLLYKMKWCCILELAFFILVEQLRLI